MEIKHAIEAARTIEHPLEPGLRGIYGTIFTGPPSDERADLRNVTIFADAEVDRSPCGTGTCAVMAVVDAMGLLERRQAVRPRKPDRDAFQRPRRCRARSSASIRRSFRRSKGRPGSPASIRFSSTRTIRSRTAFESDGDVQNAQSMPCAIEHAFGSAPVSTRWPGRLSAGPIRPSTRRCAGRAGCPGIRRRRRCSRSPGDRAG